MLWSDLRDMHRMGLSVHKAAKTKTCIITQNPCPKTSFWLDCESDVGGIFGVLSSVGLQNAAELGLAWGKVSELKSA